MKSQPLRVRLFNDYEIVVAGLRALLEPYADRVRVVEVDLHGPADHRADLTLYDTFGQTPFDRDVERITADPLAGDLVVYSWNTEREVVSKLIERGCRGYLAKTLGADELVDSLERIADGELVAPATGEGPDENGEDDAPVTGEWPGKREGLSAREAEVIALITQGLTNPEIASRSYISGNSLKSYIRSAYRKMGVQRRSQAVRWGIEHGMLPADES